MSIEIPGLIIGNTLNGVGATTRRAVRAATTNNGNLSFDFSAGQIIDGVTLVTGDRILLKNQTTASNNGIYEVQVTGPPIRTVDYDEGEAVAGSFIIVEDGLTNVDTVWICTNNTSNDIIDTNNITYKLISGDVSNSVTGVSTDNAIVRWDGALGMKIQNSAILIDDSDNMTGIQYLQFNDISVPSNPSDTQGRLYKKTGDDGIWWLPDSAGTAIDLTALSGLTNEGSGAQVYDSTNIALRSLLGTTNGLTVTQNATTITIDNTLTGSNLGGGTNIFSAKSSAFLQFNTFAAGTGGLSISGPSSNLITLDNILTAANSGGGSQLFQNKTGATLNFRSLTSGTGISLTQNTNDIAIANTGVTSITGTANQVSASASTGSVTLSTPTTFIAPGTIRDTTGMIYSTSATVSAAGATQGTATGLTTSYNVVTTVASSTGVRLQLNPTPGYIINIVNKGSNPLNIYPASGGVIDSAGTNNAISLPINGSITLEASSATQWYTVNPVIVGSSNISVAYGNGQTSISSTGLLTTLANIGGGAGVFDNVVGTTANLRSLVGTSNGLTVTQNATTITIDNTLTGSNLGAGTGTIFSAKSGASLQFNSLNGTSNGLTVSAPSGGTITLDNTLTGSNLGGGTNVFSAKSGATLQFNTFAVGTGGLSITGPTANLITLDNILTAANSGAGSQLFQNKTGSTLNFRSLTAGTGISLTQNANDIAIANTGVTSITGTANQVTASASTGAVTLSTPNVFIAPGTIRDTTGMAYSTNATVTATGTNQATATQLSTSYNVITAALAGTGVILPTPSTVGYIINIVNRGANPVSVYPNGTDQIDGLAASLPVVLPVNATATYQASSLSQWYTINPPIVAGTNTSVTYGNGSTTINASTGIFTLNTLTPQVQTMVTGTAGTNFNIASAGSTHTFNLPSASETNTGVITNMVQTVKGGKTFIKDTPLVSFVGSAVASGTNVSSLTINVPAGSTTTDMLMLAFITVRNGFSRTDNSVPYTDAQDIATPPAGWVLVNKTTNLAVYPRSIFIYIKVVSGSEPGNYTWNGISPGPAQSDTATGTATFATNVMTVTVASTGTFTTGQVITATGVTAGTTITAFGTGTGGTGTYILSTSPGTLTARAVSATKPKTNFVVGSISTYSNVSSYNSINVLGSQATPSSLTHTTPTSPPVITTSNNTLLITHYSIASVVTSWTLNSGQTLAAAIGTGPAGPTPPQAIGESMVQGYLFNVPSGTLPGYSATASNDADVGLTMVVALRQTSQAIITSKAQCQASAASNAGNTIVGTTLTIAGAVMGAFTLGMIIGGGTILSGTTITAFGTGTGGTGTYTVSPSQTTTGTFAIIGVGQVTNMINNTDCFDNVLSGFDTTGQPFFGGSQPPTASVASNVGNNITAGLLTVVGAVTGSLTVGMLLTGGTIVANTRITAFGTGTGGTGTYTVTPVQTTTGGAFAINGVAAPSFITLKTESTPLNSSYNVTVPQCKYIIGRY
jgi:hypothetical protein